MERLGAKWRQHLRFSPEGTVLGTSVGNLIQHWDVTSMQRITKLSGHEDLIWKSEFSPDGATLASASQDKSLILWDVQTGTEKANLAFADGVRSVRFTADGSSLLVASGRVTTTLHGARPDAESSPRSNSTRSIDARSGDGIHVPRLSRLPASRSRQLSPGNR